jgi:thiamine transport system permease protein
VDEPRAPLRRLRIGALALPATLFLALFLVWPLVAIGERSLAEGGARALALDAATLRIVWFTFWQAAVSTALTLVLGLPLTWALARFRFRGRALAEALALVPFVLPTLVVATALLALLPAGLHGTVWAILLAHVFFNIAVVVRVVAPAWAALDPRLWEASRSLGAGPVSRLRTLTLPLLRPPLAAAAAITFLFTFTSFGVVLVLGAPRYATLEVEIYNRAVRQFDLPTAATLALLQLLAVIAVVVVAGLLERRVGGSRRSAPGPPPAPRGGQRLAVGAAVLGTLFPLVLVPLAVLRQALTVEGGVGFDHVASLARETPALLVAPWHAIVNSLVYAGTSTALALALGIPAAVAVARSGALTNTVLMLPLGASAVMVGFGFLLAFDDPPLDLRSSRAIVPVAQTLVALPFVVRALVPALRGLDPRLLEVAATLGATPRAVRRTIVAPLLARALAAAAALAFAVALGEFGATVFLARADAPTLPVAIYRFLGRPGAENLGTAAALSVVLTLLVVAVSLIAERALARGART